MDPGPCHVVEDVLYQVNGGNLSMVDRWCPDRLCVDPLLECWGPS